MPGVALNIEWDLDQKSFAKLQKDIDVAIKYGMGKLRNELQKFWTERAATYMNAQYSGYKRYMEGLSITEKDEGVDVHLEGWLPVHLETGFAPRDMKPWLLAGRKYRVIKLEKTGEFRTVSRNSPSNSWNHPGWMGLHTAEHAKNNLDQIVDTAFGKMFDRVEV